MAKKQKQKRETPEEWFKSKHGCPVPKLNAKELQEYQDQKRFGSEREEQWVYDILNYYGKL
jgi:hypothetical protein